MNPLPLDIIVKASALLAAAGLVDLFLRRRGSAAARSLVWSLTMAAVLVLPIASYALPDWPVRIPVARTPVATTGYGDAQLPADFAGSGAAIRASLSVPAQPSPAVDARTTSPGAALTIALALPVRVVRGRRADSPGAARPGTVRAPAPDAHVARDRRPGLAATVRRGGAAVAGRTTGAPAAEQWGVDADDLWDAASDRRPPRIGRCVDG